MGKVNYSGLAKEKTKREKDTNYEVGNGSGGTNKRNTSKTLLERNRSSKDDMESTSRKYKKTK